MVIMSNSGEFIVEISMIGLGLLIAVYTMVYPQIKQIMAKQAQKIVEYEHEFNKQLEKELSCQDKDVRNKWQKIKELNDKIDQGYSPPYELFLGFIVPLSFFSIPIIKISLDNIGISIFPVLDTTLINFVCGGILTSVLLFFLIFVRLHSLAMKDFDKTVKDIRDETNKKFEEITREQLKCKK